MRAPANPAGFFIPRADKGTDMLRTVTPAVFDGALSTGVARSRLSCPAGAA